jgi:hypothetical protein
MKFVVIENHGGNFYFWVINGKDLIDAYEHAETIVPSPWLHFLVPLNELKDFVLNYVKSHKHMKGGELKNGKK